MNKLDYTEMYTQYWIERFESGRGSYLCTVNAAHVSRFFHNCRILDIGSGDGEFVRKLLSEGIDAYGMETARELIDRCNDLCPGRFNVYTCSDIPQATRSIDVVTLNNTVEYMDVTVLDRFIEEVHRVVKQYVYISIKLGNPDRHPWRFKRLKFREWISLFTDKYFSVHPITYALNNIDAYYKPTDTGYLVLEPKRNQHFGPRMTGEPENNEDDFILGNYCLKIAATYVKPADIVLLHSAVNCDPRVLEWSSDCLIAVSIERPAGVNSVFNEGITQPDSRIIGDTARLSCVKDHSVDCIIALFTPDAKTDCTRYFQALRDKIVPGGRLISIFMDCGMDTVNRLASSLTVLFLEEAGYWYNPATNAFDRRRDTVESVNTRAIVYTWMKSPLHPNGVPYRDNMYKGIKTPANIIAYGRDYENPWLVHSMISLPWRMKNRKTLIELAEQVMNRYRLETPDYASAVCVYGYELLERNDVPSDRIYQLLNQIDEIFLMPPASAHYLRWKISTSYLAGRLMDKTGDFAASLIWYERCAEMDCRNFSIALSTKTIDAAYLAGRRCLTLERKEQAAVLFRRGVEIFFEILNVEEGEWIGDATQPFDFPYFELNEIVTSVTNCVNALRSLKISRKRMSFLPVENMQALIKKNDTLVEQYNRELQSCRDIINSSVVHRIKRLLRKYARQYL
jgi:hypothetical protein